MSVRWRVAFLLVAALAGAAPAVAQETLQVAAERAREAWLAHDMRALFGSSDPVDLKLPETDPARPLGPAQAMTLLRSFADRSEELSFVFRAVRQTSDDRGYAEAVRRYRIRGTEEELTNTVFLAFRRVDGAWLLSELRISS